MQERKSSVPDREFKRPETLEEIESLMQVGIEILFAASRHQINDATAWQEISTQLHELVQAQSWMIYLQIRVGEPRRTGMVAA